MQPSVGADAYIGPPHHISCKKLSLRGRAAPVAIRTSTPKNETYKGRLFQGGLYRFEDRKEKQFM
ncbi:hypothetical protein MM35RIKEN_00850 [Vescimonas fastidiosa]|uniref:Uncharacterized protein n=1 Tax=Vescimonas fastidiosa TaxID=2714353 RepID=A0A810PZI2_9FIRM|nr:hypothetical protein MM35RIKEN_00850 [Vescimonas fastidiosa]